MRSAVCVFCGSSLGAGGRTATPQLGLHRKPYWLLNVDGYFDRLLAFLAHAAAEGFVLAEHVDLMLVDDNPERLLTRLDAHDPASTPKWIERTET